MERDYDEEEKIGDGEEVAAGADVEASAEAGSAAASASTTANASPETQQQQSEDQHDGSDGVQTDVQQLLEEIGHEQPSSEHESKSSDDEEEADEATFRPPEPVTRSASASPERSDNMDISNSP